MSGVNRVRKAPEPRRKNRRRNNMNQFIFLILFVFFYRSQYLECKADYYVDSVDGSDDNDGLSIRTPWKSHNVVHFKRDLPSPVVFGS